MNRLIVLFAVIMCGTLNMRAQFKVVDADDGLPLPGAFVFNSSNKLLGMTDANGMAASYHGKVKVSMMSYNSTIVDADTCHGVVRLIPSPYSLPNVAVTNKEFIKISGALRDVVTNGDSIILYREGLVDFYINVKNKDITRRIRACRQYEKPLLRKVSMKHYYVDNGNTIHLGRFRSLNIDSVSNNKGDTVVYAASYNGRKSRDGVVEILKDGMRRVIIDNCQFQKLDFKLFGMSVRTLQSFNDFTYNGDNGRWTSLLSYCKRSIKEFRYSKKSTPINIKEINEFVVTSVESVGKAEAKSEMKNKDITNDFVLPNRFSNYEEFKKEAEENLIIRDFKEFL